MFCHKIAVNTIGNMVKETLEAIEYVLKDKHGVSAARCAGIMCTNCDISTL